MENDRNSSSCKSCSKYIRGIKKERHLANLSVENYNIFYRKNQMGYWLKTREREKYDTKKFYIIFRNI